MLKKGVLLCADVRVHRPSLHLDSERSKSRLVCSMQTFSFMIVTASCSGDAQSCWLLRLRIGRVINKAACIPGSLFCFLSVLRHSMHDYILLSISVRPG